MGELYNLSPKLPKNVRQIGERDQIVKLYVEDYVNTYLRRLYPSGGEDLRCGLLLGSAEEEGSAPYIFIDGALEMEGVSCGGERVDLNDQAWKKAYRDMEEMFPKRSVQGWFLCGAPGCQLSPLNYWKQHSRYFPGKKIYIENDANVAAWAEAKCGAAAGSRHSVTITLGTGVGGGMILDGRLYSGFNHAGGELGHIVINEGGRPCSCGRKGCWEAYASVSGLIQTTREHMEKNRSSLMWEIAGSLDKVNGLTSFEAMRRGDAEGKAVVAEYLNAVATGIVDIINILQPEVLCIGGGISKEGDTLLNPILDYAKQEMYARFNDTRTEIRIAKLGNDAGIIGAALLGV